MTYKCKECGAIFNEPEIIKTTHGGRYEAHGYEEYGKCPNCPSDEFTECVICEYCGEAVTEGYVHFTARDEFVCDECLHDYCVDNYSHRVELNTALFPKRFIKLRKNRGLTQKEISEQLFIEQSNFSFYENGKRFPTINTLVDIANYFGVSTDYLLGG